jgi:FkbM family methyltransferase
MQRFNNTLLALALRGRGYNNFAATGEQEFLRLLSRHNPKVCIDVGANKGKYSEALLTLTNSLVVAFEPLPEAFQSLLSLQRRFPNRIIVINEGLADRDAELELHFGAGDSPLASFSTEINEIDYVGSENRNIVKVSVSTLDNFFQGRGNELGDIDLLKIDTEGFEYEVLLGAQHTIRERKPKFVQIEWN